MVSFSSFKIITSCILMFPPRLSTPVRQNTKTYIIGSIGVLVRHLRAFGERREKVINVYGAVRQELTTHTKPSYVWCRQAIPFKIAFGFMSPSWPRPIVSWDC